MSGGARTPLAPPGFVGSLLVAVGATGGAAVRWGLGTILEDGGSFPWWTFAANVVGCAGLGAVVGRERAMVLLLGAGVCGGLTTFSTLAVELAVLVDAADPVGFVYLGATLVIGIVAFSGGRRWR